MRAIKTQNSVLLFGTSRAFGFTPLVFHHERMFLWGRKHVYREKPLVFVYLEAVSCLTVLKNYPKSRTNAKELILRSISVLFSALIPLLVDFCWENFGQMYQDLGTMSRSFCFHRHLRAAHSLHLISLDILHQCYLHLLYSKHTTTFYSILREEPVQKAVKMKTFLLISHSALDR